MIPGSAVLSKADIKLVDFGTVPTYEATGKLVDWPAPSGTSKLGIIVQSIGGVRSGVGVGWFGDIADSSSLEAGWYRFDERVEIVDEAHNVIAMAIKVFTSGDYAYLAELWGHQGAAAKNPCIWCHATSEGINAGAASGANKRTADSLKANLTAFQADDRKDAGKHHGSIRGKLDGLTQEQVALLTALAEAEAEVDPDRAEKKVLEARVVCAKTNKAEYETEARRLFQGFLSQGMAMSACQPTSVHSLQMERDGVSRASHDKAKQLWEFKNGAAVEQAEAAGKLATHDAEIPARTAKITGGADRCAFHSGAFVGEHARACLYNAKWLGMSVVDAMPDASKPLALEIVKKHACLWRRLAIVHALARPSRMLAFEEVEMLKVACKDYGVAFRATFVGRNVPLKTHVLETELPAFAAKWFCCGIMCEDAAESIYALKKGLKRRRPPSVAAATPSGRPSE
ncbi:hypothetical protein M885DRAFT_571313 [Pelagophyceae sp. CCMP2097]|nr:hypothetical protein M885DRAFT_571313 [Pelagophyceae sp. CCMP2097]